MPPKYSVMTAGRLATLLAAFAATPAAAQHAVTELQTIPVEVGTPAAAEPAPEPAQGRIEEIVVTAQKKAQSLQQVPVSVGVVSGETLQQSGTFDAGGLENFVANVEIDIDPQGPVIGIRGFSTETDNKGFEPSVGLVVDELSLGRPEFVPDGLFDIRRVEILRGSQGTLFGKNTIAGVINFMSGEAGGTAPSYLALTGGEPQQQRAEAAIDLPIVDDLLSARLSGVYWDKQGDIDNRTLDRDEQGFVQKAGRLRVLATPDRWKIDLSAQFSDTALDYSSWQMYAADPNALAYARDWDPSTEDDALDGHMNSDIPGYVDRKSDLGRAKIEYALGDVGGLRDVTLTTIIGHAGFDMDTYFDVDTSAADLIITDYDSRYRQDSIEFRPAGMADSLFGLGGEVDWTLGFYWFKSTLDSDFDSWAGENLLDLALSSAGFQVLGLPDIPLVTDILDALPNLPGIELNDGLLRGFGQRTESYAVFGQMNWKLTQRLSAILGARFGWEDKSADYNTVSVGPGLIQLVLGAEPFTASLSRKETDVSPKLGLQYEWNRDLMTFATYTRGFKGGGYNSAANTDESLEFEPERSEGWELGVKSRLFDRSLMLNATLYSTDIDNQQVTDNQGTHFEISNAAEARLQGIELEVLWSPSAWFDLALSSAYGEAEYLRYENAPAPAESGADVQDLSGRTLAHAPKFTAALSPILSLPLWDSGLLLRLGADASYRSSQYSAIDLDSHSYQGGYWLFGARAILASEEHGWSIIVNGNNLADERALDLVFDHSVFANTYTAQQIAQRSVSATLRYEW